MKKLLFILTVVCVPFFMKAQSLTPSVIASTGGFSSNANGSLSYTVGEMTMVQTFTGGNNILTQGFQQPNDFPVGLIELTQDDYGSFVLYPNPAVDVFWMGYQMPEEGKLEIILTDVLGQRVANLGNSNYSSGKVVQEANVSALASGVYFVTISFTSNHDGKTHTTTKKLQVVR